jgi:Kef-type K+ transport system membrane component KefB
MKQSKKVIILFTALIMLPLLSWSTVNAAHVDPVVPILLALTIITILALIGRSIAQNYNQPSVLGELAIGILIGNIGYWMGSDLITVLRDSSSVFSAINLSLEGEISLQQALTLNLGESLSNKLMPILSSPQGSEITTVIKVVDNFSRLGLLFLLFAVGLDSSTDMIRKSAGSALRVAFIGAFVPFLLALIVMEIFATNSHWSANLIVAIALSATSIGITARVFQELNQTHTEVGRIVLSAAVIDDILGLILLAIGVDIIFRDSLDMANISYAIIQALLFLSAVFFLAPKIIYFVIRHIHHFKLWEAELFVSFLLLTTLSWLADFFGLSAIVGAFSAGLILSNHEFIYWKKGCDDLNKKECRLESEVKEQIRPFEAILAPIFFVLMGTQVKLEIFLQPEILILATALTVVAVAGKLISGLGAKKGLPRLAIGAGMVPRGEVALILATMGKEMGILDSSLFSAVVIMAIATSIIGPPLLKWQLSSR